MSRWSSRPVRGGWVACVMLLGTAPVGAAPYALSGTVVQVADGDTITLRVDQRHRRIRLASIDAPETGHGPTQPGQPFGQAARRALADRVAGKPVRLHCYEQDHYARDVCDVFAPPDVAVNRALVAEGWAWANQEAGGKHLRDPDLPALESRARAQRLGLWQRAGALAPWRWRQKCWRALESGRTTPIC